MRLRAHVHHKKTIASTWNGAWQVSCNGLFGEPPTIHASGLIHALSGSTCELCRCTRVAHECVRRAQTLDASARSRLGRAHPHLPIRGQLTFPCVLLLQLGDLQGLLQCTTCRAQSVPIRSDSFLQRCLIRVSFASGLAGMASVIPRGPIGGRFRATSHLPMALGFINAPLVY